MKRRFKMEKSVEEIAQQIGQQIGQELNQAMDSMMTKLSSVLAGTTATNVSEERTYDIGEGEAWKFNMKRMADEYQHESLESIRRNRSYVDNKLSNAAQNDEFKQNVANQALQNAVETANLVGKQAVRHTDLAVDREWNINETDFAARSILSDEVFKDAIKEAVIEAVKAVKD